MAKITARTTFEDGTTLLHRDDGSTDVYNPDAEENIEETVPEQSENIPRTVPEQSENDKGTIVPAVSQTANAIKMRLIKLLNNGQIPKQMIYPAVWKALSDNEFVKQATCGVYKSFTKFLDYPPQAVADALNRAGLLRPNGKKWDDKNLAPVVNEMKVKRRFSPPLFWSINAAWFSLLVYVLCNMAGKPEPLCEYEAEPFNIDSCINRYQVTNNVVLSGWRIGELRDTCSLNSWEHAQGYMDEQIRQQTESINNKKTQAK